MKITEADLEAVAKRRTKHVRKNRIDKIPGNEGPLSFSQTRLYFLARLDPNQSNYNMPVAFRVCGELDTSALRGALRLMIERHAVLRTAIHVVNGEPVQRICPDAEPLLREHDLRAVPPDAIDHALHAGLSGLVGKPFDLAAGQMLRTDLFRLPSDETVILLNMHHIVGDAWSLGILRNELSTAYATYLRDGKPPLLSPLPIRYLDFAAWQRAQDERGAYERNYRYWERRLASAPKPAELLPDNCRSEQPSGIGGTVTLSLDDDLARQLDVFCHEEGSTKYVVSLAAFALTLAHFTGCDAVSVGTPIANRTRPETASLVGFFVNTLVIHVSVNEMLSFRELVRATRVAVVEAHEHQHVSFERLVERLQPARQQEQNPLFQVMFSFESADVVVDEMKFGSSSALPEPLPHETTKMDLSMNVLEVRGQLALAAEFASGLFEESTVRQICEYYREVLAWTLENPERRMVEFRPHEKPSSTGMQAAERAEAAKEQGLVEFVRRHARSQPDAVALLGANRLSYGELIKEVDAFASGLVREGVEHGDVVGLIIDDRVRLIIAMLGVLRANATFLNLDPTYPDERLSYMVQDSGCRWLVTNGARSSDLECTAAVRLFDSVTASVGDVTLPSIRNPIATVIYTSGSTGRPKGVMLGCSGLAHHARRMVKYWQLTPSDRILQFNSPSFDIFLEEVFSAFVAGATLVVPPARIVDTRELIEYVQGEGVSVLDLPTVYWHALTYQLNNELAGRLAGVRVMTIGGEAASTAALRRWLTHCPEIDWINTYGPTETTVCVTAFKVIEMPEAKAFPWGPPLGVALPGSRLYVLDKWLRRVPPNAPGQLFIGGEGLAYGYVSNPTLTAEHFIPDPFDTSGGRLYASGDICRVDREGNLQFIGRDDRQSKMNGCRIELREIEEALLDDPRVENAVAGTLTPSEGAAQIYACVVTNQSLREEDILSALRRRLPAQMVPARVLVTTAMPLSPTGKADHRAIVRELAGEVRPGGSILPNTALEKVVAALWEEQFGVGGVGRDESFFDIGGHSIAAISFVSRLEEIFRMEVPLNAVFRNPVLRDFCDELSRLHVSSQELEAQAELLVRLNSIPETQTTED